MGVCPTLACNNVHVYLEGLDVYFLSELPNTAFLALGHNNGSDVCAGSECPGDTVYLHRLV